MSSDQQSGESASFFSRHQFLIRRLHSLTGLVPVGAYLVVHLLVNASVADSAAMYQRNVYSIHALGAILPVVEWAFIFLPLIFHGVVGVFITREALPNTGTYQYVSNIRYTMMRASGMIAFVFIFWHVFHMHGWFHNEVWLENVAKPLGGAMFKPYNATSTAAEAMQVSIVVPILYAIGVLATVFHFSNGIWTMGITWGWWTSPAAQRRATILCTIIGVGLSLVGLTSVGAFMAVDPGEALQVEKKMLKRRVEAREIPPAHHKALPEMADIFEDHGHEHADEEALESEKSALDTGGGRSNNSTEGRQPAPSAAPPSEISTTKR